MIFIHGDSFKNHIVAIVVPEPGPVQTFCEQNGLACGSVKEMIKHKEVFNLILNDMERLANEN
jgi:hypothetical protein